MTRVVTGHVWVGLAAVLMAGQAFAEDQAPAAPTAAVETVAPADVKKSTLAKPAAAVSPPVAAPATTKPKAKPAPAVATETLPWATDGAGPSPQATKSEMAKTTNAAAAQALPCPGLFEGGCREQKACAWIARIRRPDGTEQPAQCVDKIIPGGKKDAKKPAQAATKKADAKPATPPATSTAAAAAGTPEAVAAPSAPAAEKVKVEPPAATAPAGN